MRSRRTEREGQDAQEFIPGTFQTFFRQPNRFYIPDSVVRIFLDIFFALWHPTIYPSVHKCPPLIIALLHLEPALVFRFTSSLDTFYYYNSKIGYVFKYNSPSKIPYELLYAFPSLFNMLS